jgi:hypothetical protein
MPIILPSKLLRRASDDDLTAHYERLGDSSKDERARAQVLHEMERRDLADQTRNAREHAKFSRQLEQAEVQEQSYVAAEEATRGNMVNRKGQARGINPRTLIYAREETFRRYASDELLEHYQTHHRPTAASFRGEDTRVQPKATEPRRRQYGVTARPAATRPARPAVVRQLDQQRAIAAQRDQRRTVTAQHDQHKAMVAQHDTARARRTA